MTPRIKIFSPSIISIYGRHLLSLFGVATVCLIGLLFLVEHQMSPYFYSEFFEHLKTNYEAKESSVAMALLAGNETRAKAIIDDSPFFAEASSRMLKPARSAEERERLSCHGELNNFNWGKVCIDGEKITTVLPVQSGDGLLADLRLEYKMNIKTWEPYQKVRLAILMSLGLLLLAGALFFLLFYRSTVQPIRNTLRKIESAETEAEFEPILKQLPFQELQSVTTKLALRSRDLTLAKMATQVAHDIRSPLTLLLNFSERPELLNDIEEQNLFRSSVSRMRHLSDDLLKRYRGDVENKSEQSWVFLYSAIRSIVSEKQALASGASPNITIEVEDNLKLVSLPMPRSTFESILSNLLSNSIEAFQASHSGEIAVKASPAKIGEIDGVLLEIIDNGRGMSEEILERVRKGEGSFNKPDGNGLGVKHAIAEIQKIGGVFKINSVENKGTTFSIQMPLTLAPSWLVTEIQVKESQQIVVIDDCDSIAKLWKQRFSKHDLETHCKIPGDEILIRNDETLFLIDFDLKAELTGLELIQKYHLEKTAILVTAAFDDPKIQSLVVDAGVRMLPKPALPFIPILVDSKKDVEVSRIDLVLIDDDPAIRWHWKKRAEERKKKVLLLADEDELSKKILSKDIPIYIDKNLANEVSGLDVARRLYSKGFKNLYLSTGQQALFGKLYPFLRAVVGKEFPLKT